MKGEGRGIVIRIGETEWYSLQRQFTSARDGECQHKRLQYIDHGELILCLDCEKQLSAVWALKRYFTEYERACERREDQEAQIKADSEKLVVHRAALAVQDAWRALKFVPTCPHCHKAITPPDGFGNSRTRDKGGALPLLMPSNLVIEKDNQA